MATTKIPNNKSVIIEKWRYDLLYDLIFLPLCVIAETQSIVFVVLCPFEEIL